MIYIEKESTTDSYNKIDDFHMYYEIFQAFKNIGSNEQIYILALYLIQKNNSRLSMVH